MGLSQLSEKCRKCPFVNKCNHKQMEALAYLPEPQIVMNAAQSAGVDAAQPLLRETMTIHIEGKPIEFYYGIDLAINQVLRDKKKILTSLYTLNKLIDIIKKKKGCIQNLYVL